MNLCASLHLCHTCLVSQAPAHTRVHTAQSSTSARGEVRVVSQLEIQQHRFKHGCSSLRTAHSQYHTIVLSQIKFHPLQAQISNHTAHTNHEVNHAHGSSPMVAFQPVSRLPKASRLPLTSVMHCMLRFVQRSRELGASFAGNTDTSQQQARPWCVALRCMRYQHAIRMLIHVYGLLMHASMGHEGPAGVVPLRLMPHDIVPPRHHRYYHHRHNRCCSSTTNSTNNEGQEIIFSYI